MMRKLMLLVLVGLGLTLMAQPGGDVRIIPRPQQAALTSTSSHALTEGHAIHAPAALAAEADYLAEELAARGLNLKVRHRGRAAIGVVLKLCDTLASPEAYRLDIGSHRVTIAGSTPAGVFYGIQSLLQLLDNAPQAGATLPVGTLTDARRATPGAASCSTRPATSSAAKRSCNFSTSWPATSSTACTGT